MNERKNLKNLNKILENKLKITKSIKGVNRIYGSVCAQTLQSSTCSVRGSLY